MQEATTTFKISEQQNSEFAALSGDYNPLHVDPIYSRRLQFGRPIIHGIHHMLRAWDEALSQQLDLHTKGLVYLSASFPNPVSTGQEIKYQYKTSDKGHLLEISARCKDKTILVLRLKFSGKIHNDSLCQIQDNCPPQEKVIDQTFPPHHSSGHCDLFLDKQISERLFPNLCQLVPSSQLAQIISCTRVVGMKCPGMHSIFSRINLEFSNNNSQENCTQLEYSEQHKDTRVQIMKLSVISANVKGRLDTFFRPTPVAQPNYKEICQQVKNNEFSGQRALVIGGSRGVGETTAKILAAGGAEVLISYHKGVSNARDIQNEINIQSTPCQVMLLDTCNIAVDNPLHFHNNTLAPTHIYYFASPRIEANRNQQWDAELYQKFCLFYLQGFSEIVNLYAGAAAQVNSPIHFFYPSTIYIDEPMKGFSEYTVAKASGEALCGQLAQRFLGSTFFKPRLERMHTDQTSSIIPLKSEKAFDIMYRELKKTHNI